MLKSNAQSMWLVRVSQTAVSTRGAPNKTITAKGATTSRVNTIEAKPTRRMPRTFIHVTTLMTAVPIIQRSSGGMSPRR